MCKFLFNKQICGIWRYVTCRVPANARAQEQSACYVGRNCSAECKTSSVAAHQYLGKLTTVGVRYVTALRHNCRLLIADTKPEITQAISACRTVPHLHRGGGVGSLSRTRHEQHLNQVKVTVSICIHDIRFYLVVGQSRYQMTILSRDVKKSEPAGNPEF